MKAWIERVVWSPENGGCLMTQRKYRRADLGVTAKQAIGIWIDWGSDQEGEWPSNTPRARAAAGFADAERRARDLEDAAKAIETRAAVMRTKAMVIRDRARKRFTAARYRLSSQQQRALEDIAGGERRPTSHHDGASAAGGFTQVLPSLIRLGLIRETKRGYQLTPEGIDHIEVST